MDIVSICFLVKLIIASHWSHFCSLTQRKNKGKIVFSDSKFFCICNINNRFPTQFKDMSVKYMYLHIGSFTLTFAWSQDPWKILSLLNTYWSNLIYDIFEYISVYVWRHKNSVSYYCNKNNIQVGVQFLRFKLLWHRWRFVGTRLLFYSAYNCIYQEE